MVVHVDGDLSLSPDLVRHAKRVPQLDGARLDIADAQQSPEDAVLLGVSAQVGVEDGGEHCRVGVHALDGAMSGREGRRGEGEGERRHGVRAGLFESGWSSKL